MKNDVISVVFIVLVVVGAGFSFSGALCILRMPDVCFRVQCSSRAFTMGADTWTRRNLHPLRKAAGGTLRPPSNSGLSCRRPSRRPVRCGRCPQ
jgi:hypothetical protein